MSQTLQFAVLVAQEDGQSGSLLFAQFFIGIVLFGGVGAILGNNRGRMGLGLVLGALLGCIGWGILYLIPKKDRYG